MSDDRMTKAGVLLVIVTWVIDWSLRFGDWCLATRGSRRCWRRHTRGHTKRLDVFPPVARGHVGLRGQPVADLVPRAAALEDQAEDVVLLDPVGKEPCVLILKPIGLERCPQLLRVRRLPKLRGVESLHEAHRLGRRDLDR